MLELRINLLCISFFKIISKLSEPSHSEKHLIMIFYIFQCFFFFFTSYQKQNSTQTLICMFYISKWMCNEIMYKFLLLQTNKPLTEKRRRERINKSLLQLKNLVLRGTNKQVCLISLRHIFFYLLINMTYCIILINI
jgi:hypothetical protein